MPTPFANPRLSSRKGVFWKRGLFGKVHILEILEIVEISENLQAVENEGASDHFPEILEILELF